MNLFFILLGYVLNIRSEEDLYKVQKVFFLENNFSCADREQFSFDETYLRRVDIFLKHENASDIKFYHYSESYYPLKATNLGYVIVKDSLKAEINSFLNSSEINEFILKLCFFCADKHTDIRYSNLKKFKGKVYEYITYKLPEKNSENTINFKCGVTTDIFMKHTKRRFENLLLLNLVNLNEYLEVLSKKKEGLSRIEDGADFDLYYYKNYSECLENLQKFIDNLRYLNLQAENDSESFTKEFSEMFIDETTTLKVLKFNELLREKCHEILEKQNINVVDEIFKPVIDQFGDYCKGLILEKKIFFPVESKYNIDYYIKQLSNIIIKLAEQIGGDETISSSENKDLACIMVILSLDNELKKLQEIVVNDLCNSEHVSKHFFDLLKREVKTLDDYFDVGKMVGDFYNMFVYIFNLHQELIKKDKDSYLSYLYFPPIFINDFNLRIIDGVKIEFKPCVNLEKIRGYDDKGKNKLMKEDIDYFINEDGVLYCPSEVLKKKNIQEIEVILIDDKINSKKFKINEYLSV